MSIFSWVEWYTSVLFIYQYISLTCVKDHSRDPSESCRPLSTSHIYMYHGMVTKHIFALYPNSYRASWLTRTEPEPSADRIDLILHCIEVMWPGLQGGHRATSVWIIMIISPVSMWLGSGLACPWVNKALSKHNSVLVHPAPSHVTNSIWCLPLLDRITSIKVNMKCWVPNFELL